MKRGILDIPKSDLNNLLDFIKQETNFDPFLIEKINSALESTKFPAPLQLSEYEAESLIDLLPPPTTTKADDHQSTRQVLSKFLAKIKFSSGTYG